MPAGVNRRATESMATASSRELRPALHEEQGSIPTAYSQKETGQSIPHFLSYHLCFPESERNEEKSALHFCFNKKINVLDVRQAQGPETLQDKNEKEAIK